MLEEMTGISREIVHKIFEDLKKKEACACFVPHLLTPDQTNVLHCLINLLK
jgi:hypothetical protein